VSGQWEKENGVYFSKFIHKKGTDFMSTISSPGPCAYNPKSRAKTPTPSWSIHGTKTRAFYQINNLPGPGSYNPKLKVFFAKTCANL